MHALKISACGAMLMLIAPVAAAHPPKHGHARVGAAAMPCSDMHAHMHGTDRAKARHPRSGSAMMHGGMNCMSHQQSKAPPAQAHEAASPPEHDHMDVQPPK